MAESESNPSVGRPRKELSEEIVEVLRTTDDRAMTLGMITEQVDGARRTVKDRLDTLADDGRVEHQKIGNATAYWIPDADAEKAASDGGIGANLGDRWVSTFSAKFAEFSQRAGRLSILLALLAVFLKQYELSQTAVPSYTPILLMVLAVSAFVLAYVGRVSENQTASLADPSAEPEDFDRVLDEVDK